MLTYLNFDLRIEGPPAESRDLQLVRRLEKEYRVTALAPGGQASAPLRLPFAEEDLAGLLSRLRQLSLDTAAVQKFGGTLFRSAFTDEVLSLFRASQEAAHEQEAKLRIRLQIHPPELAELPWEYLFDPEHHQFLATSIETPILRYLPLPERKPLRIRHPLRLLVTLSSPEGFPALDLEKEWANLVRALSGNRRIELVRLERPTLDVLLSTLRRDDFHIFHFVGHGQFDTRSGEGLLVLEREDGKAHLVPGWALGEALHDERTLRLAVINACEGASFGGADPFAGVAQAIVQKGIPAVIAMQTLITDKTAVTFAGMFYSALADGYPVDAALTEARKLIFTQGNAVEWGAPVLFLRSEDGQILDIEVKGEQPPETPAPSAPPPVQAPAATPKPASYEIELSPADLLARIDVAQGVPKPEPGSAPEKPETAPRGPTPAAGPEAAVPRVVHLPVAPATGIFAPRAPVAPTMAVEVDAAEVTLRFGDRIYRSRLRLDAERLVAAVSPREYGEALFDALFNPGGLDGFDSSTLAGYNWISAQAGVGKRIELELRTLELQDRKWEYLADSRDRSELPLAAVQSQPFYRRWGNARSALAVARPLRILAAVASPATLGRELDDRGKKVNPWISALSPIDIAQERDILETGLQRLAGFAEYHVLDGPVTLAALREALQDGYHVLHLLAHGLLVEGSHYLVLEGGESPHHLVAAETFCDTLQGSSLRLVVLAACQSAVPDAARSLRGLGASLLDAVPAVIAMQDEVRIDTAQLFTQHFYDRLARTGRVDQAMARTRAALYQEGGGKQWQWGIPVLLMSTGEGRLFDMDEARIARELPRLEPQVKSYQELAGAGDPTVGKWERSFGAAARAYDLPLTVLPAPAAVSVAAPAAPAVELETLTRPQDRAELLALARIDLDPDELSQEIAGECRLDLPPGVYAQIASALNAGKHVILIGPPGTGKTSLAHAVCKFASRKRFATSPATLTTATADWTAFDTVGGYVPTLQQTLQFRAGVFLEAIRTGRWLVIDEINRAEIDKAFGELFTVLAGQQVDLPYSVGPYRVRVLPPNGSDPESWLPEGLLSGYDYVIHPNWRIVATMNVYDKSHLFTLSFAFMRRFAFIDVELPGKEIYDNLVDGWLESSGIPAEQAEPVREALGRLLTPDNPLTSCRELGPAIVKDMIAYMSHRHSENLPPLELLAEALLLYVTPQLDGIDSERIVGVRRFLADLVGGAQAGEGLLRRVKSLYPHVPLEAWT